jgi:hypothetical protein
MDNFEAVHLRNEDPLRLLETSPGLGQWIGHAQSFIPVIRTEERAISQC